MAETEELVETGESKSSGSSNPPPLPESKPESKIFKGLVGIAKGGLIDFFRKKGLDLSAEGETSRGARLKGWFKEQRDKAAGTIAKSVGEAMTNQEVKELGAQYVSKTIEETVDGVKKELPATLTEVAEAINKDQEDARSTYQKIRDVIGYDEKDKWYTKVGKNVLARVVSFGLPVINFVSAKVAAKISQRENPTDEKQFRGTFDKIYNGLLTRLTPPKKTQPVAPTE